MSEKQSRILKGAQEALSIARGEMPEDKYKVHVPVEIDVRRIRKKLNMTQAVFARTFGFNLSTLRHWEQKRRTPEGPARAYLVVIDKEPERVRKALAAND
jgi:putative transcriptional regulator